MSKTDWMRSQCIHGNRGGLNGGGAGGAFRGSTGPAWERLSETLTRNRIGGWQAAEGRWASGAGKGGRESGTYSSRINSSLPYEDLQSTRIRERPNSLGPGAGSDAVSHVVFCGPRMPSSVWRFGSRRELLQRMTFSTIGAAVIRLREQRAEVTTRRGSGVQYGALWTGHSC